MLVEDVVFWTLSAIAIVGALGVVLVRDLFRSALLLAVVFIAVAGFFLLLSAEFLAVVQVLIYVGAITILIIFAVMLTRDVQQGNLPNRLQIPAALLPALLLSAVIVVAGTTEWRLIPDAEKSRVDLVQTGAVSIHDTETLDRAGFETRESQDDVRKAGLADLLIGDFVVPFEAASVLLLAAVIGALALARPGQGER